MLFQLTDVFAGNLTKPPFVKKSVSFEIDNT